MIGPGQPYGMSLGHNSPFEIDYDCVSGKYLMDMRPTIAGDDLHTLRPQPSEGPVSIGVIVDGRQIIFASHANNIGMTSVELSPDEVHFIASTRKTLEVQWSGDFSLPWPVGGTSQAFKALPDICHDPRMRLE